MPSVVSGRPGEIAGAGRPSTYRTARAQSRPCNAPMPCDGDTTMPTKPPLNRLHEHTQTKRTAKRTTKRTTKRTAQLPTLSEPSTGEMVARDAYYPKGHFGPQH